MEYKNLIQHTIDLLASYFSRRYRQPIFNVQCKESGDRRYILEGSVLLRKQKEILKIKLKKIAHTEFIDKITVLSEWDQGSQDFYYIKLKTWTGLDLSMPSINVYRRPVSYFLGMPIRKRRKYLSTQITVDGLPFRIIDLSKERWLLVQVVDGTIGWIRKRTFNIQMKSFLGEQLFSFSAKEMQDFIRKFEQSRNFSISKKDFQEICKEFVGIRYSLGANSEKRIDCSALVQKICYQAFGFLLPKKSTLQRDVILSRGGNQTMVHPLFINEELIEDYLSFCESSEFGKLIFLLKKNHKRSKHVAIWFDKSQNLLMHSSHGRKGVVIEDKEELMKEYEEWDK